MKRQIGVVAVGIVASSLLLAGCGQGSGSGAQSNNANNSQNSLSANLTLWDIQTGQVQQMVKDQTTAFNKANPNITVTPEFFQNNPYKNKLRIALGAGNPPDIFYNWGGGPLQTYVNNGDVLNLTPYLNADPAWKNRFLSSSFGLATVNGKIYGIPVFGLGAEILYYNKPMFKQYNLTPPKTFDELLADVKVLHSKGVIPIALAGESQWPEMEYVQYLTDRLGGPNVLKNIIAKKPNAWSDPAIIKALQMCQELVQAGAFEPGYSSVNASSQQTEALLYGNRAAMEVQGNWIYSTIEQNDPSFIQKGDLGFLPFPGTGGSYDQNVLGAPGAYYSVSSKTKNPTAAVTYLKKAVQNSAEIKDEINNLGFIPAVHGATPLLQKSPNAKFEVWLHGLFATAPDVQDYWDQYLSPTEAKVLLDNISNVFLLKETPQQFADAMNKQMMQG
ncbi:extracellular solute-binding protein [Alicyclobacillus curvatus]|nr:extracellular solute-binding protein [Alicyclobacillus curvatus]